MFPTADGVFDTPFVEPTLPKAEVSSSTLRGEMEEEAADAAETARGVGDGDSEEWTATTEENARLSLITVAGGGITDGELPHCVPPDELDVLPTVVDPIGPHELLELDSC